MYRRTIMFILSPEKKSYGRLLHKILASLDSLLIFRRLDKTYKSIMFVRNVGRARTFVYFESRRVVSRWTQREQAAAEQPAFYRNGSLASFYRKQTFLFILLDQIRYIIISESSVLARNKKKSTMTNNNKLNGEKLTFLDDVDNLRVIFVVNVGVSSFFC